MSTASTPPIDDCSHFGPPLVTGMQRAVYLGCAGLFLVLGGIGAILPIVPATPFLLLASYFLIRTSPALNHRLLRSKFVGPILADWQRHRGVRRAVKWRAMLVVAVSLTATLMLARMPWPGHVGVLCLASIGMVVIARLPVIDTQPTDLPPPQPL